MDGNRRIGDPLDAAAPKRFPDLFVIELLFRPRPAQQIAFPLGDGIATKVKRDGDRLAGRRTPISSAAAGSHLVTRMH